MGNWKVNYYNARLSERARSFLRTGLKSIVESGPADQICTVIYERVIDKRVALVIRANQSRPHGVLPIAPPPLNCSRRKGSKALHPFANRAALLAGFCPGYLVSHDPSASVSTSETYTGLERKS